MKREATVNNEYREVGHRLYEIKVVSGAIRRQGRDWLCFVEHDDQRILVSDLVPSSQHDHLADRAASEASRYCPSPPPLKMMRVPMLGPVA